MKKFIVTTTIYTPSDATLKFCKISEGKGWHFIIVGDTKTPHQDYRDLENEYSRVVYLDPDTQQNMYPALSDSIGWKCIQRRNIGFVYAYQQGAELVATIDDDNIPYDDWGDEIFIGEEMEVDIFDHKKFPVFDPISATTHSDLWHRGYPIEFVSEKNNIENLGKAKRTALVQADFWDGDPDVDAVCRLTKRPEVTFEKFSPFSTNQFAPFNSQNTFLSREVIPYYAVLPHVGRMDDIWGSYILQHYFPKSIVFNRATVYQDRNEQDLVTNMENEIMGYRNTLNFIEKIEDFSSVLPEKAREFWNVYRGQF